MQSMTDHTETRGRIRLRANANPAELESNRHVPQDGNERGPRSNNSAERQRDRRAHKSVEQRFLR